MVSYYYQGAFDCVDNTILNEKLKAIGVSGDMGKWLMNYLTNRSQIFQIVLEVVGYTCMQMILSFIPLVALLMRLPLPFK